MKRTLQGCDSASGSDNPYHQRGSAMSLSVGRIVWYSTGSVDVIYLRCRILALDTNAYTATIQSLDDSAMQFVAPLSNIYECDETFGLNDNAELKSLNYPNVVENIKHRFLKAAVDSSQQHLIYTYAGWVLFAVNPYNVCPSIYSDSWCDMFYAKNISQSIPHPFATASTAFSRLLHDRKSQYILISGESGGGKTECSKHILKYLTWVTRKQRRARGRVSVGGPGDAAETLAQLLIASSPILEFFGNAKTSRNDNSSRFGKLFQIFYDRRGEHLLTAHLSTYLLAKSRVVQVPHGEENYHIFHALKAAYTEGLLTDHFQLTEDTAFTSPFLGEALPSRAYCAGGDFHLGVLLDAFEQFGITSDISRDLFKVLLAILLLGCLEFKAIDTGGCTITNTETIKLVARLLGLDENSDRLKEILTSKQIRDTRSQLDVEQSRQMTHSLAKGLYESLFHFVVYLVRQRLEEEEQKFRRLEAESDECCVGVLDLFGFENMEPGSRNGFEQLCINYANEQLHSHFMKEVVQKEQEIYREEGLGLHGQFSESLDKLFTSEALTCLLGTRSSPGIFALLEEASMLGGADRDESFCRRANQVISESRAATSVLSPHKKKRVAGGMEGTRALSLRFTIDHYAEAVTYTAIGFAARNQDHLSDELRSFLISETGTHVKSIVTYGVQPDEISSVKKSSMKSLSAVFVRQMGALISGLEQTSCFFVKCLKPNDNQQPFKFQEPQVLRQLVTGGVGPVLDIMKCGYPCRLSYSKLWDRYRHFLPTGFPSSMNPRDFADLTMRFLRVPSHLYRLGVSRVFFKLGVLQQIEALMDEVSDDRSSEVVKEMYSYWLQSKIRDIFSVSIVVAKLGKLLRRIRYRKVAKMAAEAYYTVYLPRRRLRAVQLIAQFMIDHKDRLDFLRMRRSAIRIQRWYRVERKIKQVLAEHKEELRVRQGRRVAAIVTAAYLKSRLIHARRHLAAARIQAVWKGVQARRRLKMLSEITISMAVRRIQRWWRRQSRERKTADLSRLRHSTHAPTPLHRKQIVPPSCLRDKQRRGSIAFRETKDFWEVATLSVGQTPDIRREVGRRRRSLFTTELGKPFCLPSPAVFTASQLLESPRFGAPSDASSKDQEPLLQPTAIAKAGGSALTTSQSPILRADKPPISATPILKTAEERKVLSPVHPRSRRAIQSGKPYGGLDSAEVVDIFAQALETERSSRLNTSLLTPSHNLLEGLSSSRMGCKPSLCKSNSRGREDSLIDHLATSMKEVSPKRISIEPPPFVFNSLATVSDTAHRSECSSSMMDATDSGLLGETTTGATDFESQIPLEPSFRMKHALAGSEPPEKAVHLSPGEGRLSIRAWQFPDNGRQQLAPSFSDITMQGVNHFLKMSENDPVPNQILIESASSSNEEDFGTATPLFGSNFKQPNTRESDMSDLLLPPDSTVTDIKDCTPRPYPQEGSFIKPCKVQIPAFKKALVLTSAPKGNGAERSRIPQRPSKPKGKDIKVITIGTKSCRAER